MKSERMAGRLKRSDRKKRQIRPIYFYIITDAKETEENYLNGLKNSLKEEQQKHIKIDVVQTKTYKVLERAIEHNQQLTQYGETWIVFDRDQVKGFDEIIENSKVAGISVAWSNPCIEIWFFAYFHEMPNINDSVKCCRMFADRYQKITGKKYEKSDKDIYQMLLKYGDENDALKRAEDKEKEHIRNGKRKASEMIPSTLLYQLVAEIKQKAE